MKRWHQIIALFLLAVLSTAIIPAESFHAHEESEIVCKEQSEHIEEKHFQCDLCEFVLPVFTAHQRSISLENIEFQFKYKIEFQVLFSKTNFQLPDYRGPPLFV